MAIDKTIPNRLQADADQRLVRPEVGEMLDAQNVTMAEGGGSSSGVIKNVRGTIAGEPLTAADRIADDDAVRVIGSVSDPQRGFIYWFVADVGGNSQDAIYQYNTSDDTYRVVFKDSRLNFDHNGFVKADIVNAAFQQDGIVQSILYFTDNNNPPKKINVDRAIAGDYDRPANVGSIGYDRMLDRMIECVRRPPIRNVDFFFESDENFKSNNFIRDTFQFSIQYIYKDGEESAMSSYSKLAFPDIVNSYGVEDGSVGYSVYTQNVCVIDTKWSSDTSDTRRHYHDVKKIRLLARNGNEGVFFIIDEFDPNENLYRNILEENFTVYNASSGLYRFYNDGNYTFVSSDLVNKLYDNVPFVAAGQAVAGNRLMYSNYTEGRPSHDPGANMTVSYAGPGSINSFKVSTPVTETGFGDVSVDFLGAGAFTPGQIIPAGSKTTIEFPFRPTGNVSMLSEYMFETFFVLANNFNQSIRVGFANSADSQASYVKVYPEGYSQNAGDIGLFLTFSVTVTNISDISVADLVSLFADAMSEEETSLSSKFQVSPTDCEGTVLSVDGANNPFSVGDQVTFSSGTSITAKYSFSETDTSAPTTLVIKPRLVNYYPSLGNEITVSGNNILPAGSLNDPANSTNATDKASASYSWAANYTVDTENTPAFVRALSSTSFASNSSFKMGASHEFGVVYYDDANRSSFVNKIGSVYVDHVSERSSGEEGAAGVTFSFSNNIPTWANSFQIVYTGNSSWQDVQTYTTGRGYYVSQTSAAQITNPVLTDKRIYVSLKTLDLFSKQKSANRDYSFTKGDKLRIVSYDSETGAGDNVATSDPVIVYPSANDGSPIEFDVVGVVALTEASNGHPVEIELNTNNLHNQHHTADDQTQFEGTFLILEATQVVNQAERSDGTSGSIKYPGFDWYSISATAYPDGTASPNLNHWGKRCVVEILTPKKNVSEKVYYEIGDKRLARSPRPGDTFTTNHGPNFTLFSGDVHYRTVSAKTPYRNSSGQWNWDLPKDWRYEAIFMESKSVSDIFNSEDWDRGRPHAAFESAATVRRYNGITYSDAYAEDVANLSLSSFNGSLANFFSLESANGACNYIDTFRDGYLLAFQENRVSRVGINKDIITTPAAGQIPTLTTQVLGEPVYYLGDFGCGDNPESVLIRDGNAFFVDTSRKKLVRLTAEGLSPISENGVDSMFKTNLDSFTEQGGTRIVSGYDPEDNQYYVTLREAGAFTGFTLGYNISAGVWQSRYTFYPDMYADQNGTMYSAYYNNPVGDDNAEVFHHHTNETDYNTFYGSFGDSLVKVVSNANPSMVKVFNSISLEGNSANWTANPVATDLSSLAQSKQFVEKEGSYYSEFTRDTNGTKHTTGIGRVASLDSGGNRIKFVNRVNRNPIPYGSNIRLISAGAYDNIGSLEEDVTFVKFVDSYTIEVAGTINLLLNGLVGGDLVAISESTVNGDPVRGHWAEITLTNNQATPFELYCVNTHIVQSHQDHSLGQQ